MLVYTRSPPRAPKVALAASASSEITYGAQLDRTVTINSAPWHVAGTSRAARRRGRRDRGDRRAGADHHLQHRGRAVVRLYGRASRRQARRVLMPEPDRSRASTGYMRRYMRHRRAAHHRYRARECSAARERRDVPDRAVGRRSARTRTGGGSSRSSAISRSQRAAEQRARALEVRLAQVGRFNLMGEMAAGIAHEINQPLSAIATYAQAAKRILEREQPGKRTLSGRLHEDRRSGAARGSGDRESAQVHPQAGDPHAAARREQSRSTTC